MVEVPSALGKQHVGGAVREAVPSLLSWIRLRKSLTVIRDKASDHQRSPEVLAITLGLGD